MKNIDSEETSKLTKCRECGAGLFGSDRFCRTCGVSQTDHGILAPSEGLGGPDGRLKSALPTTQMSIRESYRQVSGPLIESVSLGVHAAETIRLHGRAGRILIFALVSIPMWLLIIFLSPLDAYAAAKCIAHPTQPQFRRALYE